LARVVAGDTAVVVGAKVVDGETLTTAVVGTGVTVAGVVVGVDAGIVVVVDATATDVVGATITIGEAFGVIVILALESIGP
jgi:hypothetical protein